MASVTACLAEDAPVYTPPGHYEVALVELEEVEAQQTSVAADRAASTCAARARPGATSYVNDACGQRHYPRRT